jgi:hypothetical protein
LWGGEHETRHLAVLGAHERGQIRHTIETIGGRQHGASDLPVNILCKKATVVPTGAGKTGEPEPKK